MASSWLRCLAPLSFRPAGFLYKFLLDAVVRIFAAVFGRSALLIVNDKARTGQAVSTLHALYVAVLCYRRSPSSRGGNSIGTMSQSPKSSMQMHN